MGTLLQPLSSLELVAIQVSDGCMCSVWRIWWYIMFQRRKVVDLITETLHVQYTQDTSLYIHPGYIIFSYRDCSPACSLSSHIYWILTNNSFWPNVSLPTILSINHRTLINNLLSKLSEATLNTASNIHIEGFLTVSKIKIIHHTYNSYPNLIKSW